MKLALLATVVGLALAAVAVARLQPLASPARALARSGWPLLAAGLLRLLSLTLHTAAWRALLPPEGQRAQERGRGREDAPPPRAPGRGQGQGQGNQARFWRLFRFRWIGEAVNNLLPVLQVGGDLARARLLVIAGGLPAPTAAAAGVLDLTTAALAQAAFTAAGATALLSVGPVVASGRGALWGGTAAVVGGAVALVLCLRFARRPLLAAGRRLMGFPGRTTPGSPADLEAELGDLRLRRRALFEAFTLHLLGWLTQALETLAILALAGHPVSFASALVIESLAGAARAAAFFIPGGLGVQEGAVGFLALALGVPPDATLTLVIVKRLREVAIGAPALLLWLFHERRLLDRVVQRLAPGGAPASDGE